MRDHKRIILAIIILVILLFASSCIKNEFVINPKNSENIVPLNENVQSNEIIPNENALVENADEKEFAGIWRIYSERIFYDIGGSGSQGIAVARYLELSGNGKWKFGSSSGIWEVTEITETDWAKWGIESYGPTRKIILNGWSNGIADGPIEEEPEKINFIWIIYRAEPPIVKDAGAIQFKLGHINGELE